MKVGVTLPKYYEDYLQEISKVNNLSITTICGLIIENYLSYNKNNNRVPLFVRNIKVSYVQNVSPEDVSVPGNLEPSMSREEMLKELNIHMEQYKQVEVDDDELPF